MRTYTLTKAVVERLRTHYRELGRDFSCHLCEEDFKEGDEVIVAGGNKHYHPVCLEASRI